MRRILLFVVLVATGGQSNALCPQLRWSDSLSAEIDEIVAAAGDHAYDVRGFLEASTIGGWTRAGAYSFVRGIADVVCCANIVSSARVEFGAAGGTTYQVFWVFETSENVFALLAAGPRSLAEARVWSVSKTDWDRVADDVERLGVFDARSDADLGVDDGSVLVVSFYRDGRSAQFLVKAPATEAVVFSGERAAFKRRTAVQMTIARRLLSLAPDLGTGLSIATEK